MYLQANQALLIFFEKYFDKIKKDPMFAVPNQWERSQVFDTRPDNI
jgi:hypothetical protein